MRSGIQSLYIIWPRRIYNLYEKDFAIGGIFYRMGSHKSGRPIRAPAAHPPARDGDCNEISDKDSRLDGEDTGADQDPYAYAKIRVLFAYRSALTTLKGK